MEIDHLINHHIRTTWTFSWLPWIQLREKRTSEGQQRTLAGFHEAFEWLPWVQRTEDRPSVSPQRTLAGFREALERLTIEQELADAEALQKLREKHPGAKPKAISVWKLEPISFKNENILLPHVRGRFQTAKEPGSGLDSAPSAKRGAAHEATPGKEPVSYRFVLTDALRGNAALLLHSLGETSGADATGESAATGAEKKTPSGNPGLLAALLVDEVELTIASEGVASLSILFRCIDPVHLPACASVRPAGREGARKRGSARAAVGDSGDVDEEALRLEVRDTSKEATPLGRARLEKAAMMLRRGFSGKPSTITPVSLQESQKRKRSTSDSEAGQVLATLLNAFHGVDPDPGRARGGGWLKDLRDALIRAASPEPYALMRRGGHRHSEPSILVYAEHPRDVGPEEQFALAWRLANQFDGAYAAPTAAQGDLAGLKISRPMGNRMWAASRNGVALLAAGGGVGDVFTHKDFPERVKTDYSALFHLALHQREFLLNLREETADEVQRGMDLYLQEDHGKERKEREAKFERILRRKQDFITHMLAKHASDSLPHAEFYGCVWRGLGMDTLIESTQLAVQELKDRMDRESDRAEERAEKARRTLSQRLTYIALPATLVSSVLSLNLKEFSLEGFWSTEVVVAFAVALLGGLAFAWVVTKSR